MKKKIKFSLIAFAMIVGVGVAMTITSPQAVACEDCNTSDTNRKCGKCGSHKLFSDPNKKDRYEKGHLILYLKCKDCGHEAVKKVKC